MNNFPEIFSKSDYSESLSFLFFLCAIVLAINITHFVYLSLKGIKFVFLNWFLFMFTGGALCVAAFFILEKVVLEGVLGLVFKSILFFGLFSGGLIVCGIGDRRSRVNLEDDKDIKK